MRFSYYVLAIGIIMHVLSIIQFFLHAEEDWIGEVWDSELQENLYCKCLVPISLVCILVAPVLLLAGV